MEQQEPAQKAPSKLKGRKLEPKYKGPNGELWAGRGKLPKWMQGQDKEQFRLCGLVKPCPDCGPAVHDVPEGS